MGRPTKLNLPKDLSSVLDRVGANLRDLRDASGLSQAAVAAGAKISATTLNQLETQRGRDVRLSTLVALARTLGCSVERLFATSDLTLSTRDQSKLLRASEDIARILRKFPADG